MPGQNSYSDQLPMFILDVLRHDDIEPLQSIISLMNDYDCVGWRDKWPHEFTKNEVIPELKQLIKAGYVDAITEQGDAESGYKYLPISYQQFENQIEDLNSIWFSLTDNGRAEWDKWEPPVSEV